MDLSIWRTAKLISRMVMPSGIQTSRPATRYLRRFFTRRAAQSLAALLALVDLVSDLGLGAVFLGVALAALVAGGFRRRGRVAVTFCKVALIVLLEVRFVPAAPLQPETGCGHELLQRRLTAGRAVDERIVAHLLQRIEFVAAGLAAVLVNRHGSFLRKTSPPAATHVRRAGGLYGHHAAFWNSSRSSLTPTSTVSPGLKRPSRISRASGFSTCC